MLGEFWYSGIEVCTMLGEVWYYGVEVCTMLGEFWYNGMLGLYHVRGVYHGTMVVWRFVPCYGEIWYNGMKVCTC